MCGFVRTFEFLVSQRFDATAMHTLWRITTGTAGFDGVFVQIVGQPAQVAVAHKWIACQMPMQSRLIYRLSVGFWNSYTDGTKTTRKQKQITNGKYVV